MKIPSLWVGSVLFGLALFSAKSEARVLSCTSHEPMTCKVIIRNGIVGDSVRIADEKGREIAKGKITQLSAGRASVMITSKASPKPITRRDFAYVTMEARSSNVQWGAAFSKDD